MGDNKKHENKATRKSISLETKMQVIRRLDTGESQSQIGAALNLETSTIRTPLKNKEKILSLATARSANRITLSRSNIIEEMEKRLSIWIDDEIERNMPLSQSIIIEKARRIFNYIFRLRQVTQVKLSLQVEDGLIDLNIEIIFITNRLQRNSKW
ncbi:hypothetical protein TNCT_30481 [Trichonephila clavata]|uniref:HTH psq-type domain-containing protein n=1 Tax=Trichonephila clavata TaxID=2740835 RepID=A0A8X6FLF8_TRICU|nr:hypothetical protein TNCT_30481 [Trichonephila clavata]